MLLEIRQQVSHLKINIMAFTCNLFLNQGFDMFGVCCSRFFVFKVRKMAKIRNRYNQAPHQA